MSRSQEVEIKCKSIRETNSAVLIEVDGHEQLWIPLSQVSEMRKADDGHIVMSQWIANQKGLI